MVGLVTALSPLPPQVHIQFFSLGVWGAFLVITHPLEIVSAGDGVSDGMVGADARQAFGVDDGTQGGVGMCGPA